MTLFLRDKKNRTLVDIDIWVKTEDDNSFIEIRSSIDIEMYSLHLLSKKDRHEQFQMISYFNQINEVRGWLWETYFMGRQNNPLEYDNVLSELRKNLEIIAEYCDLHIVED